MGRPRKNRSPFEELDQDFKESVDSMSDEDVRKKLSEVAIHEHQNLEAKKQDQDLAQKKVLAQEAGEIYKEATKFNRLRTRYCYQILEQRGKV